jgi:hypothetical protein
MTHSTEELVQFHTQILSNLLQRVASQRAYDGRSNRDTSHLVERFQRVDSNMVLDELSEVLEVEDSAISGDSSDSSGHLDDDSMAPLSHAVKEQLKQFVARVSCLYHPTNPFHSFEHASHVTFSAYQLLRSVVANDLPKSPVNCEMTDAWSHLPPVSGSSNSGASGLTSDNLAQFALIFSALIHDVEHVGVPNTQLAKERPTVAAKYQNRSLAEQTSVDVAWELLEEEQFHGLRACIFPSRREYERFRAMVVNTVMSTDIADAALRAFNNRKWEKAFGTKIMNEEMEYRVSSSTEDRNRKATVLMDLIMMSSDISHTMQSFDVFCEWNERLFREMYAAYRDGRSAKDPSEFWYLGEMIFYDKHIIPLARRLKDSGMFGPVAFVLLQNAQDNRRQWHERGQQLLQEMQQRLNVSSRPETTLSQTSSPDLKVVLSQKRRLSNFVVLFGIGAFGLLMRSVVHSKIDTSLILEPPTKKQKTTTAAKSDMPDVFRLVG